MPPDSRLPDLPRNLGALLDAACDATPEAVALHFTADGSRWTYRELRDAVNRLAHGLRAAGIGAGSHVAVMLPNVAQMPVTWLALARLSAVMIPVNTRFTGHELHYAIEDGNAAALVIDRALLPAYETMPQPVARLAGRVHVVGGAGAGHASFTALSEGQPATWSEDGPDTDAVLNLQYTSGTTGFPKGCILTHRYWLTCAHTYAFVDGLAFRRILADNPFFYMTPQWLLLMAFFHRATLYVAPRLSASGWLPTVREHGIEYCLFRDAYYREPPTPHDREHGLLRASLYMHRKEDEPGIEARFGPAVRTAFGMTEIGAGLVMPLDAPEAMSGAGSCGVPAPHRECRIADAEGRTLPDGEHGELVIRGPGLMRGYYGKPDATAAAFHGDWFRTGDLARRDGQGRFYVIGRLKDVIKRAGENVAPEEVESVLASLPGVREAAVVGVPDALRGEEIKAILVLDRGHTPESLSPEVVRAHCRERLAVFKQPRYVEYRMEPLPRTASGKVAKAALRGEGSAP